MDRTFETFGSFRMTRIRKSLQATLALTALLFVLGQPGFAQDRMEEFRPLGAYQLFLDGGLAPEAEIYHSKTANAFLVMDDSLPAPFLVQPRRGSVETVNLMKVESQPDGSIDLLPEPTLASQGDFSVEGEKILFTIEGIPVEMRQKPSLLGDQDLDDMATYDPEYARRAELYTPSTTALAKLKGASSDVTVRVFFGSWCPHCQQVVPRIMRVEEEISGSNVKIEYYGLPRDMNDDKAKALSIRSVPTGVIYRDGKEIGRLSGNGWKYPEATLVGVIEG